MPRCSGWNPDDIADRQPAPTAAGGVRPGLTGVVEWGVAAVHAPEVWAQGATGQGIVVADADTGNDYTHPALRPHYRGTLSGGGVLHDYSWHDAIHSVSGNPAAAMRRRPAMMAATARTRLAPSSVTTGGQPDRRRSRRALHRLSQHGARLGTPERYTECFQFFIAPTDSRDKTRPGSPSARHQQQLGLSAVGRLCTGALASSSPTRKPPASSSRHRPATPGRAAAR